MRRAKKKSDPKKTYDLISKDTDEGKDVFALIASVKKEHCTDIASARIGAAWLIGKKADKDGHIVLGKMKKASELERRLHKLDAIVLLNQDVWRKLLPNQRVAVMHHQLCHLADVVDPNGEVAYDGHGERKWRIVRHDIEEFRAVVHAHGCYTADIASFVRASVETDPQLSLFNGTKKSADEDTPTPKKLRAVK